MGSDTDALSRPADTMRERIGETRVKIWFLINANRWFVTGVLLAGTYLLLLAFRVVGPSDPSKLLGTGSVSSLFGSMVIAIVTSVTLVLSISQFALTEVIGPLGQQREEMADETQFREDVEAAAGVGVSPVEPSRFLRTLVETAEQRAESLNDAVTDDGGSERLEEVAAFTDGLVEHSRTVSADLEGATFGSFETLLPVLNYNYSWKIFAARSLREKHADSLSDDAAAAFDDLIESLRFFGPAREYFKTLYVQWEIINISRGVLYGAMPALALAGYMILEFDGGQVSGSVFGISTAYLVVSALYVLTLTPFAVLLAYLLRVLTVLKRTLAIGPFILRETDQLADVRNESVNRVGTAEENDERSK